MSPNASQTGQTCVSVERKSIFFRRSNCTRNCQSQGEQCLHTQKPGATPRLQTQKFMARKSNSVARRLLIISYHFPPDGAIGGQRWAGLSKYLARLGWEVHIVTASAPGSEPSFPNVH